MAWTIKPDPRTEKELRKIGHQDARRIRDFLRDRVGTLADPRKLGKPLKGQSNELWRYRVGSYRVICQLRDGELVVLVIRIDHRKALNR